jgi:hypothetical protein
VRELNASGEGGVRKESLAHFRQFGFEADGVLANYTESCACGPVRGAPGNRRLHRDHALREFATPVKMSGKANEGLVRESEAR